MQVKEDIYSILEKLYNIILLDIVYTGRQKSTSLA